MSLFFSLSKSEKLGFNADFDGKTLAADKKKHLRNEKNKNNILGLASSIGRLAQSAGGLASSARRMKPVRCRI